MKKLLFQKMYQRKKEIGDKGVVLASRLRCVVSVSIVVNKGRKCDGGNGADLQRGESLV